MSKKTRDGIRLESLVQVMTDLGFKIKEGSNHKYLALYPGMVPCPLAISTDVRRMVVPWVVRAKGYNAGEVYQTIKSGKGNYII